MSLNTKKSLKKNLETTNVVLVLVLLLIGSSSYLYLNTNTVATKPIKKQELPKVEICYFYDKESSKNEENKNATAKTCSNFKNKKAELKSNIKAKNVVKDAVLDLSKCRIVYESKRFNNGNSTKNVNKNISNNQELISSSENSTINALSVDNQTIKSSRRANLIAFNKFKRKNDVAVQEYSFDSSKDTLIICDGGTILMIPENTFDVKKGKKVKLEVQEYLTNLDIALKGLSTTSYGKILESEGMLNIIATSDNKEIKLKKNKRITVNFFKQSDSKMFELFYGKIGKDKLFNKKMNWILDSNAKGKFDFTLTSTFGFYDLDNNKKFLKPDTWNAITNEIIPFQKEIEKLAKNNRDVKIIVNYYAETENPDVKIMNLYNPNINKRVSKVINDAVKKMQTKTEINKEFGNEFGTFTSMEVKPFDITKYKTVLTEKKYDAKNYNKFNARRIGWINCDRFTETPKRRKDLIVYTEDNFVGEIILKFKNLNSFMKALLIGNNKYAFKNIPNDMEVVLIGIKMEDKKPYLKIKNLVTGNPNVSLKNFKPFEQTTFGMALKD